MNYYKDDKNDFQKMLLYCIIAASLVVLLLLVILYMGQGGNRKKKVNVKSNTSSSSIEEVDNTDNQKLTSEDLDFWEMADKTSSTDEEELEETKNKNDFDRRNNEEKSKSDKLKDFDDSGSSTENLEVLEEPEILESTAEKIEVKNYNGESVFYDILESVPKNTFNFNEHLKVKDGGIYYDDPKVRTVIGVDVSKYQGTIDWKKVKDSGISFAMLRVASRGYTSGEITLDDKFVENAKNAKEAGVPIGVYFYSQAKDEVEAVEEANFAVAACVNYGVTYPIACDVEIVTNDNSRTADLTPSQRTQIIKTFCDTVKSFKLIPIIYASRDYLISQVNLEELTDYDVWLSDEVDVSQIVMSSSSTSSSSTSSSSTNTSSSSSSSSSSTNSGIKVENNQAGSSFITGTDYPYRFSMWQYTSKGNVAGISGSVDLDMCFVNYRER